LRFWPYAGSALLVGIIGLALHLYLNTPLLINPFVVLARIESGSIEQSSLHTMAILLPIAFLMVCVLLLVLVLVLYAAFSNEKKYLEIVRRLEVARAERGQNIRSGI